MAKRLVPKHCVVHSIELLGGGRAAVRYRCVRDGLVESGQHSYSTPSGVSNYPSKTVKADSVSFRGVTVSGRARMGFVLSPDNAECHKDGRTIRCKIVGGGSLSGVSQKKRRR